MSSNLLGNGRAPEFLGIRRVSPFGLTGAIERVDLTARLAPGAGDNGRLAADSTALSAFREALKLADSKKITPHSAEAALHLGMRYQLLDRTSANTLLDIVIDGVHEKVVELDALIIPLTYALAKGYLKIEVLARFYELPFRSLPIEALNTIFPALLKWAGTMPNENQKLALDALFSALIVSVLEYRQREEQRLIFGGSCCAHSVTSFAELDEKTRLPALIEAADRLGLGRKQLLEQVFSRADGKPVGDFVELPLPVRDFVLGLFGAVGFGDTAAYARLVDAHAELSSCESMELVTAAHQHALCCGLEECFGYRRYSQALVARVEREIGSKISTAPTEHLADLYLDARRADVVSPNVRCAFEREIVQRLTRPGRFSGTTPRSAMVLGELCARDTRMSSECQRAILQRLDRHLRETQSVEEAIGLAFWMLSADAQHLVHCSSVVHRLAERNFFSRTTLPIHRRAAVVMGLGLGLLDVSNFAERDFSLYQRGDAESDPELNQWRIATLESLGWAHDECERLERCLPDGGFLRFHPTGLVEMSYEGRVQIVALPHPPRWRSDGPPSSDFRLMIECERTVFQVLDRLNHNFVTLEVPTLTRGRQPAQPLRDQLRSVIALFFNFEPSQIKEEGEEPRLAEFS